MAQGRFGHVPLVKVTRGRTPESVHYGSVAVVDATGRLIASVGNPRAVTFIRSAAKPFQVLPLIFSEAADHYGLTEKELAVMMASHNGEENHLKTVRSILRKSGVAPSALKCGAHEPLYPPAARALVREGRPPTSLHNNCSGKHAGMLALTRFLGASQRDYLSPRHPVQKMISKVLAHFTSVPARHIQRGVDGCSAPAFALSLRQAALGYARLVDDRFAEFGDGAARRAVAAMRRHPEMVGGTRRPCTAFMRAIRCSFIAKIGAEGFYGMAYRDGERGVGIALKISDGDPDRARTTAAVEILRQLGLLDRALAHRILAGQGLPSVKNVRGRRVGRVVSLFQLA